MAVRDSGSLLLGLLVLLHTWRAWAAVEVTMEDKVSVYVGGEAQIICMYTSDDGSGGLTSEWFSETRSGTRVKERIFYQDSFISVPDKDTRFTDRISVNKTSNSRILIIRDVQLEDELEFICAIKSLTDGSGEGRTKLQVFVKPNLPTIEGVEGGVSVRERHPSKIGSCEVKNGYPKPNITWYRNSTPLRNIPDEVDVSSSVTIESSHLYSVESKLRKKIVKEDKDAYFYCEVTYVVPEGMMMSETRHINVTVYYPSTAVRIWVESPKGKIKEGDSVELHCSGNGNDPSSFFSIKNLKDDISWDGNIKLLENVTRQDSGDYACISTEMENFDELSDFTTVFVNYLDPAVVMPSDTIVVAKGDELKATCNALSSLPTKTTWFKNKQEVSKGHTLILKNATFDTAGLYTCMVTVPEIEEMTTSSPLLVYVQGPPEIIKTSLTEIETYDKTTELVCDVRGYPAPTIIWTSSDGKVLDSAVHLETDYGSKSRIKVDVPSDVTALCKASNKLGTDSMTFNIKAKTIIHTTTPAITTIPSTTVIHTTTPAITTIPSTTVKAGAASPPKKIQKESNGVIIAVVIICILLLAILGSVLYFLYKKGKICGRSGKQDLTKEKSSKDNIVVEMKSDNTEEAILLGVNGEKQPPNDQ